MSNPVDHHYLPVFYLKRWANKDGKVFCFTRPYGNEVKGKMVSPGGTGYEPHLYSVSTLEGPPNPIMEQGFMSRLDDEAAKALKLLEQRLPETKWDPRYRSAWSRYIWAQLIRTPSEVAQLKSLIKEPSEKITPGLKEAYELNRPESAPNNVDEYLTDLDQQKVDRFAIGTLRRSMDNPRIGRFINNMNWKVIDFENCGVPLITSDQPVWMNPAFAEPGPAIVMPIGPTNLFVATQDTETMRRIEAQSSRQIARSMNKASVQHAVKFVFAKDSTIDSKMRAFVQKHFATHRQSTPMERIAAKHGHGIVAEDSPLGSLNNEMKD